MNDLATLIAGLDGISIIIGLTVGFALAVLLSRLNRRSVLNHVSEHLSDEVKNTFESVTETIETSVKSSSSEALKENQQQFLTVANDKLADQRQLHSSVLDSKQELIDTQLQQQSKEHNKDLETKKELIDKRLTDVDVKLGKVERLVQELQTDRKSQYSALDEQLKSLTTTTQSLQTALADNRARGQWGERIAEDILQLLGFVEGKNYTRQSQTELGKRPDFTFLLPNQMTLNMDAKFPLDNYLRYYEAASELERKNYSDRFLVDVKKRVTEIQKRDYIDSTTINCVLVFIPNEQIYRFIHEQDDSIIDTALRQRVVLCSPLTLYIVLAVIRQAAQNFNVEQNHAKLYWLSTRFAKNGKNTLTRCRRSKITSDEFKTTFNA